MAKTPPAADQMELPGVELDDQGKFGFATPGEAQEKETSEGQQPGDDRRRASAAESGQAGQSQRARLLESQAAQDLPGSRFPHRTNQRSRKD